jgi:hypothetical protein
MLLKGDQMTSKTLISVAIASTFGWAAAVHAGPGHGARSAAGEQYHSQAVMQEHSSASERPVTPEASPEMQASGNERIGTTQWDSSIAIEPVPEAPLVMLDDGAADTWIVLDDNAYMASTYDVILLPGDVLEYGAGSRTRVE